MMPYVSVIPESLVVVMQIGICCCLLCSGKGSYGILDSICNGTNRYPQRIEEHKFEELRSKKETKDFNSKDVGEIIECCLSSDCYAVGKLDDVCEHCTAKGRHKTLLGTVRLLRH